MKLTDYHAKYFAHELTKRCASDSLEKLAGAVAGAQVDLNPHQIDAALFAFRSPLSRGALLADEVGLGKTIEAGLVLAQRWAERKRRILIIVPANLRKQWHQELSEKFFLPCRILEAKPYNEAIKRGVSRPFDVPDAVVICSYQFARSKAADVATTPWDLVVIDEAHRLRNVYKPTNVIANTLKRALEGRHKLLLTATPLQNSLLELFGLVSIIDDHSFGDHDHVLTFSKSPAWLESGWNMLPRTEEQKGRFKNPDNDPEGPWRTYPLDVRTEDGARREKYRYEVGLPSGRTVKPAQGRHWALPPDEFDRQRAAGEIYFGKDGDAMPTTKVYLKDARQGVIARTWWTYKEVGGNQDAKREVLALFGDSGFITPKPEALLHRVLTIATNPGDVVLDSFAGSGTTGAVAHKMGRRWIMVELGEHCHTHIIPRLKKVIDGADPGGITEAVGWKGGGGFRYYRLAPSLLEKDKWGNWVISREYNAAMLAEAVCKLEGFTYAPSDTVYWQHGHSTERDFIYVTTAHL